MQKPDLLTKLLPLAMQTPMSHAIWLTPSCKRYLQNYQQFGKETAITVLAAQAIFGSEKIAPSLLNKIMPTDAYLLLPLGHLIFRIGCSSQMLLSTVLQLLSFHKNKSDFSLPIPVTVPEFWSFVFNQNHQWSLHSLIPSPNIKELSRFHAMVLLPAFIQCAISLELKKHIPYKFKALTMSKGG